MFGEILRLIYATNRGISLESMQFETILSKLPKFKNNAIRMDSPNFFNELKVAMSE